MAFQDSADAVGGQSPDTQYVGDAQAIDGGITFVDLFRIIRKHAISAIVTFAIVFVGVCGYTLIIPPQYTATSKVFATYDSSVAGAGDYSTISTAGSYISNQLKSYPALAKTEAVLQPVIDDLGLDMSVGGLAESLTVTNPSDTVVVEISVENENPSQSAAICNAVAESLQTVVSKSLYSGGKASPVQLTVVQQATEPGAPSSPKIPLNLAIGVVLGLVLGIMVALLKNMLATRVQESSELIEIIDAPVMGRIPSDGLLNESKPVVISSPDGPIAEEFRRIRTNLSFTMQAKGSTSRLIVISSTAPAEGKTTVSVNIAAALAENGASVLLIDADLRHPSVADKLGLEGNAGLVHVLSGQSDVKDVIQRYWKPNLHVMPAGPKPPNPSVLLNSSMMRALVSQALKQYDYVLIDTSPLKVANDAAVFGEMGNGVVLVSGRDVTVKRDLKDIASELGTLDVPVTGFVLNYVKEGKKRGKNDYYYYYGSDDPAAKEPGHKNDAPRATRAKRSA